MKYLKIMFFVLISQINFGQTSFDFKKPFTFPTNAAVYEFTKYGNVPVNEYRGLANISIPIYDIKLDDINLPLNLTYYSGGVKVADEAGIVGLGWNMNLPTIIQTIKDADDFDPATTMQDLPGFTGNPILPWRAAYERSLLGNYAPSFFTANACDFGSSIGYTVVPNYYIANNHFLIQQDGKYKCNGGSQYEEMVFGSHLDTEPDTFTVNLNGIELIMIRDQPLFFTFAEHPTLNKIPLKIINGRIEYKVEYSYDFGIKITDPNGTQYFFNNQENIFSTIYKTGFMEHFGVTNGSGSISNRLYKLTKIITQKNKEINFTYTIGNIIQLEKKSYIYNKNISTTGIFTSGTVDSFPKDNFDDVFYDADMYFRNNNVNNYPSVSFNYQSQNYYFLQNISTPNENISFTYSDRIDYQGMKKLDLIKIDNIKGETVKKSTFNYDYFGTVPDYQNKRLKLNSYTVDGENSYLFQYNETPLPAKNSFSIDYWGYYNGFPNTSLYPSLSALGYPQYNDNSQNNFNANINFSIAGSLEKIKYPTGGSSKFIYESHEFDNLVMQDDPTSLTVNINYGSGLRIKEIDDFTIDNQLSTATAYNYQGGKSIFKKRLARRYNLSVYGWSSFNSDTGQNYHSDVLEVNLLNGNIGSSVIGQEDYIGYDKVTTAKKGSINIGKVEKTFFNNAFKLCNPVFAMHFIPYYYQDRNYKENGSLLSETTFNNQNIVLLQKDFLYNTITSQNQRYGVSISSFDIFQFKFGFGDFSIITKPNFLITSYPIFANSTILIGEKTKEFFNNSNPKETNTDYNFDIYNNLNSMSKSSGSNISFYGENYTYNVNTEKNIFSAPSYKSIFENGNIKNNYTYNYNTLNNCYLTTDITENNINNQNTANTVKFFYDTYDDKNNIIQYHRDNGVYTCIIWGYNKTLPIAKIENATYDSIVTGIISASQNNSNTGTEGDLLNSLNLLRSSLPNAMVTTYTHRPLIGISTITDEKGDKKTFEYDSLNRLKSVKDKNGNILSENEYHFKL
jgi:hypothetical protein